MVKLMTNATEIKEDGSIAMVEIDFSSAEQCQTFKGTELEADIASDSILFEIISEDGSSRGFIMKVSDFEAITKFIKVQQS